MTELKTFRVHFQQTTIREVVLNARDAEEAIGLAQADLFGPRDTSQTVACYLGKWDAVAEKE